MKSRKLLAIPALAVAFALSLAGCGGTADPDGSTGASGRGDLVLGILQEPASWDPAQAHVGHRLQPFQANRAKFDAHQLPYREADLIHEAAHQAIAALVNRDFHRRDVAVGLLDLEFVDLDRPVLQLHAAQEALPGVPHYAIFDTAFFAHLPAEAYTYAIDREVAQKLAIRRYGFHGTSHNYVSHTMAAFLGHHYDDLKMIVCHLGNGASVSAVAGGRPVETSMGLTPLQGLVMGTRSGDIDPGVHAYLCRSGLSIDEVDTLLNKKSGMLGLCGRNDFRDVATAIDEGDADAKLAFDVYIHRLVGYIGNYMAILGGVDAVAFTAGVGENDDAVRAAVCGRLANLGFHLDADRNGVRSKHARLISTDESPVKVLVVPTNEELQMAREVRDALSGNGVER